MPFLTKCRNRKVLSRTHEVPEVLSGGYGEDVGGEVTEGWRQLRLSVSLRFRQ